jgi:DNA-binding transcriptional regulator LsrR (DeoR family)
VAGWLIRLTTALAVAAVTAVAAVISYRHAWHFAGRSQRAIARDLGIDRRKIKRIIDHPT